MKFGLRSIVVMMWVMALFLTPVNAAPLVSTFDNDTEGWGVWGGAFGPFHSGQHQCIFAIEAELGPSWYFTSPDAWSASDWTQYIGGNVSWDLFWFENQYGLYGGIPDLAIVPTNPEERIRAFNINVPEFRSWTHFSINLIPQNFRDINNDPITADQFYNVMSSFQNLFIRGEYGLGYDASALDNVMVTAAAQVPEPATLLYLGAGFLGLAAIGRNKLLKR